MSSPPSAFADPARCNIGKHVRFAPTPIVYSTIPWKWVDEVDEEGDEVIESECNDEPCNSSWPRIRFTRNTVFLVIALILAVWRLGGIQNPDFARVQGKYFADFVNASLQ